MTKEAIPEQKKRNKRIFQILLITTSIGSLFFVPWLLVKSWILPLPDTVQEQLDEAIGHGFEGMVVYIDQTGQEPQYFASGWHNREEKIPARPDALYKIASISKLFDAVAVTKLTKEGRLDLDKTIADYLPQFASRLANSDKITLRMMLQHRSGLPNFTDTPGFWESPTGTFEEGIALIYDQPAEFEPDTDYAYCNTNYLLLNKIMDVQLGYENFEYKRERILKPLELNHTFGPNDTVNMDDLMSGYHVGYPNDLKADGHNMLATAEDVGILIRALNNGSIFNSGEKELYVYEYEHDGWVPGYQSFSWYNEELDAVIVTYYNTTDPKLFNWNLSQIINNRIVKILKKQ